MTGPADYEGLAALFGHDGHPLGWAGLPGPAEIGKFADLMYFDISVLLADFAFVPEKSLNDLAVTARGKHSAGQSHRSGHESRQASAAVVSSVTKSALPRV
jgi:hypothetical protein